MVEQERSCRARNRSAENRRAPTAGTCGNWERLSAMAESGKLLQEHIDHVEGATTFIHHWQAHHGEICPTCGSGISSVGGIEAVTKDLALALRKTVAGARASYALQRDQVKAIQSELATLGVEQPPIATEVQSHLHWKPLVVDLLPITKSFGLIIFSSDEVGRVTAKIRHMRRRPLVPTLGPDIEGWVEEIVSKLSTISDEHEMVSQLAVAWVDVEKRSLRS